MNQTALDVSIVMPLQNAERHVGEALRQLEGLNFTNFEIVIIDDGSTDGTANLIRAWAEATSQNHKLLRNSAAQGVSSARNLAALACDGAFIWFVDCDDEWSVDILKDLWASVNQYGSDIAVCNAVRRVVSTGHSSPIDDAPSEFSTTGIRALELLLTGKLQGHLWNKLFRRSLVTQNPFPPTRAHSDLGGVIKMLAAADIVSFEPTSNYVYKVRAGSILNSSSYRWDDLYDCARGAEAIVRALGDPKPLVNGVRRFKFTHILVPLANERVRRQGTYLPAQLPYARSANVSSLVSLAIAGDMKLALRLFAITRLSRFYSCAYAAYNRQRWGHLLG